MRGDAVRLGVRERWSGSARAMSKEARGFWDRMGGDCELKLVEGGRDEVGNVMERSEVGVESSMTGGWVAAWPDASWSCWSCCCCVRIICNKRFYSRLSRGSCNLLLGCDFDVRLELLALVPTLDVSRPDSVHDCDVDLQ